MLPKVFVKVRPRVLLHFFKSASNRFAALFVKVRPRVLLHFFKSAFKSAKVPRWYSTVAVLYTLINPLWSRWSETVQNHRHPVITTIQKPRRGK
jgi:hypothetical protein